MSYRDDFEKMVQLAEFGARRHDERRQVEFRIFIAYMTLLVLAFYQIDKIARLNFPLWGMIIGLLFIHFLYIVWQIRLSRALVNDALRRNFYLKKAECILHHLWEEPCSRFFPRKNRFVTIGLDYKKNKTKGSCGTKGGKISEYELFKMHEPNIELVSSNIRDHWSQITTDWSRPFQTLTPTAILIFLILALWRKSSEPQNILERLLGL